MLLQANAPHPGTLPPPHQHPRLPELQARRYEGEARIQELPTILCVYEGGWGENLSEEVC